MVDLPIEYDYTIEVYAHSYIGFDDVFKGVGAISALLGKIMGYIMVFTFFLYYYQLVDLIKKYDHLEKANW